MTLNEVLERLNAWVLIAPGLGEQQLFNVSISPTGELVFTLDEDRIRIPIV